METKRYNDASDSNKKNITQSEKSTPKKGIQSLDSRKRGILILGLLCLLFVELIVYLLYVPTPFELQNLIRPLDIDKKLASIDGLISKTRKEKESLNAILDVTEIKLENMKLKMQIEKLQTEQENLKQSASKIEKAIFDNPEKMIEVTLLKKDLDILKNSYEAEMQVIREEISKVYGLSKWFIALNFTMVLALFGFAINSFLSIRRKQ